MSEPTYDIIGELQATFRFLRRLLDATDDERTREGLIHALLTTNNALASIARLYNEASDAQDNATLAQRQEEEWPRYES